MSREPAKLQLFIPKISISYFPPIVFPGKPAIQRKVNETRNPVYYFSFIDSRSYIRDSQKLIFEKCNY